jgi:hypothetical protein
MEGWKMISIEQLAADMKRRHQLTSLHIFDEAARSTAQSWWRVFGFRKTPEGFSASAESGAGPSITDALANLDARLAAGPIRARTL